MANHQVATSSLRPCTLLDQLQERTTALSSAAVSGTPVGGSVLGSETGAPELGILACHAIRHMLAHAPLER